MTSNFDHFDQIVKKFKEIEIEEVDTNQKICPQCNTVLFKDLFSISWECEECGYFAELDTEECETLQEHNVSRNQSDLATITIKTFTKGKVTNKKYIGGNTTNYSKMQKKTTIDTMIKIMQHHDGRKIPESIINMASLMYHQIQQYCIKRGDVRLGTMAACVYRICKKEGIIRKPSEIASIFKISQSELSNGEKTIDKFISQGILTEEYKHNEERDNIKSYLERYFECLHIPHRYLRFTTKLIKISIKYNIAASSVTSSKCAGAIHVLTSRSLNKSKVGSSQRILDIQSPTILEDITEKRNESKNESKNEEVKDDTEIENESENEYEEIEENEWTIPYIIREDIERECEISRSTFTRFSHAIFEAISPKKKDLNAKELRLQSKLEKLFKRYNLSKVAQQGALPPC